MPEKRCELCGHTEACVDCHFYRHYEASSRIDAYSWIDDGNPVEIFRIAPKGKVHLCLLDRRGFDDRRAMCGRGKGRGDV